MKEHLWPWVKRVSSARFFRGREFITTQRMAQAPGHEHSGKGEKGEKIHILILFVREPKGLWEKHWGRMKSIEFSWWRSWEKKRGTLKAKFLVLSLTSGPGVLILFFSFYFTP